MAETFTGSNPMVIPRAIINRGGVRVATIAANESWTLKTSTIQILDGGAADRTITLPTIGANIDGARFHVYNAGSTDDLILSDGSTVVTIVPGDWAMVVSEGTDWVLAANSGSPTTTSADNVTTYWGTGNDIGIAWDGTKLAVTQAAPNSAIDLGVDGAGIDLVLYGDTASAALTWDQSADSLILSGVAKLKLQTIADPGDAGAIPVTHSGYVALTSAGAETRTLAAPTYAGQHLTITCDTYVGDIVVTVASGINVAGNTIMTFGVVDETVKLEGVTKGGTLRWQVVANDGVGLTGP